MSILSTDAYRSTTSPSTTTTQNPNNNHGLFQPSDLVGVSNASSVSTDLGSVQSQQQQIFDLPNGVLPGAIASAGGDSGSSSKKVTDARTSSGKKVWHRQNYGAPSKFHQAGRGGISSQFRYDQGGPVLADGNSPRAISSPQNRRTFEHVNQHATSAAHPSVKKTQIMNGNHLLNFQYDPISRPQPRMPPPRKQQKIKPYNKDLFIQANYKFVVLDSGDNVLESMDPDKMLQWDNVVCVRYSTPQPVQCPICLESPLCPQITSCGHIFCFPCILRYLLMGAEDHKGDCWKKCPLCFMTVSSKDLYTIKVENVKQHNIGDDIEFALLTRAKGSLIPYQRSDRGKDVVASASVDLCDSFSKFTLASDVDLSVREEISEISGWLARADSGLVDDLEQLPYVCAAMEQLEQRKKCWAELRTFSSSPPLKNHASPCSNTKTCKYDSKTDFRIPALNGNVDLADSLPSGPASSLSEARKHESELAESSTCGPLYKEDFLEQTVNIPETFEVEEKVVSPSYDDNKYMQKGSKDMQEKESYSFYQAIDGQHFILHPLNMKCLLHFYGSYNSLPTRIGGKILQLETVTQSEAMRRRFRYLSHFSLTTTFQLCEIDLSEILPRDALSPFMDEIMKRENQRKRIAKKEHMEKVKAEAEALQAMPIPSSRGRSSSSDSMFTMDDFEALGGSPVSSTSPPLAVGERKRFSDVTRLGFASAHDSPSLTTEEFSDATNQEARSNVSISPGQRSEITLSFANIISTMKAPEIVSEHAKTNGSGKKGKKPTRVLLSTAGGRRY